MAITDQPVTHQSPEIRPDGFWDGVARSYIPGTQLNVDPSLELHTERAAEVDPVTAEVVRYALLNANFEHADLIQRLCVSPVTMLTRDYQASVLCEDGDLVCLGANLQYFSTAHAMTVKWTLENRSGNPGIRPGDVFLSNDPYVGAPLGVLLGRQLDASGRCRRLGTGFVLHHRGGRVGRSAELSADPAGRGRGAA
jgi:hypothetical protein